MNLPDARLYLGDVVHVRSRPRVHRLTYRVFSLLIDVDQIEAITARSRILSHNRANLLAINDRDHGDGKTPIGLHARALLSAAGCLTEGRRIHLLCYPRLFGYVINPLAAYFVHDPQGLLETVIYQVQNTFGERRSYVVPAGPLENGIHAHGCAKELFVSPFTDGTGSYTFRVRPPGDEVLVAVLYRGPDGPTLRAHFRGVGQPLNDRALLRAVARMPFMTLKVFAGIHWEALKLWAKGVPLAKRHRSPKFAASRAAGDANTAPKSWRTPQPNISLAPSASTTGPKA